MKRQRQSIRVGVIGIVALVVTAFGIGSLTPSSASVRPSGVLVGSSTLWIQTNTGDTWMSLAAQLVPGASSTDQATYARLLDQENCHDTAATSCDGDSLSSGLQKNLWVHYQASDFPPNSTTTTSAATTTTAAATTTSVGATTTTTIAATTTTAPPAALAFVGTATSHGSVGSATTGSLSCASNNIVVAYVMADSDGGAPQTATITNTSTPLTFHAVGVENADVGGYASIYWAVCDGSAHGYNVTMAHAKPVTLTVQVWSGANTTTPFPPASVRTVRNTSTNQTVGYTSTVAGSEAIGDAFDYANGSGMASSDAPNTEYATSGTKDGMIVRKSATTPTVGTAVTLNFQQTGSPVMSIVVAEMVPVTGGGGGTTTTTTTIPATTTTVPPTGKFHTSISSNRIVDPLGNSFLPKGVNCGIVEVTYYPPTSAYTQGGSCDSNLAGHLENHAPDATTYGFNIMRMNVSPGDSQANIQKAIDDYSAAHIVAQIDCHVDLGGEPSFATWAASGCASLEGALLDGSGASGPNKSNTYFWLEPLNEEWQNDNPGWVAFHQGVDDWVRTTHSAPDTMIVADAPNYGQDWDDVTSFTSLLSGRPNQVVELHSYGGQFVSGDQTGGSYTNSSDAIRTSQANALVAAHIPVIIGETGYPINSADAPSGQYANTVAGTNWALANAWGSLGFGGIFWHGTGDGASFALRNCSPATVTDYTCAWYTTGVSLRSGLGDTFMAEPSSSV